MADQKAEIVAKLVDTRSKLEAFLGRLDEASWETAVYHEDTTWTVTDIMRHVVDSERGMTNMITQWQQGKDPVPADFDLARWNNRVVQKAAEKTPSDLLTDLKVNRQSLLNVIDNLQPDDWGKQGRHASLRIMSIEQVCHLIADHEADHLAGIQEALGVA